MTTTELSKFWQDVATAYTQVALNHEREVKVSSNAEDLTATVEYDSLNDTVVILVAIGTDTVDEEGDEIA